MKSRTLDSWCCKAFVFSFAAVALACSSSNSPNNSSGSGGSVHGNGGATHSSGGSSQSSGGTVASPSGGIGTSGGAPGLGGATGSGGRSGSGGSLSSGGASAAGGSSAAGGTGSDGSVGAGGTKSTGGSTSGTGGSSSGRDGSVGADGSSAGTGGSSAGGSSAGTGGSSAGTGGSIAGTGGSTAGTGGSTGGTLTEVWVAPTGSDSAAGTEAAPLKTPAAAIAKLCPTSCPTTGGTIWLKAGTYSLSATLRVEATRNGTAAAMMKMWSVDGQAVFDFSSQPRPTKCNGGDRGFQINGNYWHIKGVTVQYAADNGIFVGGGQNTIENCIAHDNQDFGIGIGAGIDGNSISGTHNLILNCDAYHNFDKLCDGENADGFGAKKNAGEGNIFRGCRSWENSDDGYDFYGWTSPITLENCWAFSNAKNSSYSGSGSDGNGFKLGSDGSDGNHKLSNCSSWSNAMAGFTNNGGKNSSCTGCTSCSNTDADKGVSGVSSGSCPTSKGTAARNSDGSLP